MDKRQLYKELTQKLKNLRFKRLCLIAEAFGFQFKGGRGSHRIYYQEGIRELLNFQNVNGKAKPYQVRQLIKIIEKYDLFNENDENNE
jgi:hypothetical protein